MAAVDLRQICRLRNCARIVQGSYTCLANELAVVAVVGGGIVENQSLERHCWAKVVRSVLKNIIQVSPSVGEGVEWVCDGTEGLVVY